MIEKIKKHGVRESIEIVKAYICNIVNDFLYYMCCIVPIDENLIVFESEGDLSDNAYALYAHMMQKGLFGKYKAVWLVDDVTAAKKSNYVNTYFVTKHPNNVCAKRSLYLATCKWYIYDHCNLLADYSKRKDRKIINLWHGCGFKGGKNDDLHSKTIPDYTVVTGRIFKEIQAKVFGFPLDTFVSLGYPRNDYLFDSNNEVKNIIEKEWRTEGKKVLLWMPTFRRSVSSALDEAYFHSTTGLPIIDTSSKLEMFNEYLKSKNSICLFKLHHLQAELNVFKGSYSNIRVIRDEQIKKIGIQLYELVKITDCLISDYSSVTTDYMLLNKPIIFTLDDYNDYRNNRGFAIDNPAIYFAGDHVTKTTELIEAIDRIVDGMDRYKKQRNKIMSDLHAYVDGNASERILQFLNIN